MWGTWQLRLKIRNHDGLRGFTIVELLIVVVVIAILAAITVVAYNGITSQAKEASLKSDLKSSAAKVNISKVETGTFPDAQEDAGLVQSGDNVLAYYRSGDTFCISATNPSLPGIKFQVTESSGIEVGNCLPAIPDTQVAKLLADDGVSQDQFGRPIALSGNTLLIGANTRGSISGYDSGSVYVFVRDGESWTQQAKLTVSDRDYADEFGRSVAIEGDTAIIGSFSNTSGNLNPGAVYVFTRSGSTWTKQARLTASDGTNGKRFGASVALSSDTALIGSKDREAYAFTRTGNTWMQQAKLAPIGDISSDIARVSLFGDTALLGVGQYNNGNGVRSGAAYVFTRSGSTWSQQATIIASDNIAGDQFGASVSLFGDTALIGANGTSDLNRNSAYVFVRSGVLWSQQAKLIAEGNDKRGMGDSVSLFKDTAIVGRNSTRGPAYIFTRMDSTWSQRANLIPNDNPSQQRYFGSPVAIYQDTVVVGAAHDNHNGVSSGAAYIFQDLR